MSRAPRIDGQVGTAEWAAAASFDLGAGTTARVGNDARTLYLSVVDSRPTTVDHELDQLVLFFDDESGSPPILDDGWWEGQCHANPTLGDGQISFSFTSEADYVEWWDAHGGPFQCPPQPIRNRLRAVVAPAGAGVSYEIALPLDGTGPLQAAPGQRFGISLQLFAPYSGSSPLCYPAGCASSLPNDYRNLFLASGGCNSGPQRFDSGPPLDWTNELFLGSGQGWIRALPPGQGDPVFCQGNDTGGTGSAACVSDFLQTSAQTVSRLHMPLALGGQSSARLRLRALLVVDPNGGAAFDALAITTLRQDGSTDTQLSWFGQDQNAILDLPLSLAGSPPVELLFTHATWSGGVEGGYAQIDDVELLCEPLFADGFESGDTSAWSEGTANACPTPTGGPTLHANSVAADETWTANGSPHVLTGNLLVPSGVTLTVAPCAEVRIRPGLALTVQGTLVARGTPQQHVAIRRDNLASPWSSIWIKSPGFAELAYAEVSGGGGGGGSILVEGVDTLPPALPLRADHLTVSGSTSHGLKLFRRAGFAVGSTHLVVSGAGATDPSAPFPIRMPLNAVGTLPVGSYTGNASDLIQVVGDGNNFVEVDDTFHDRGVPYQIGGPAAGGFGLIVVDGDPTLATLRIDAGVQIHFYGSGSNIGGLFVGTSGSAVATGRLVAAGTTAAPILFTGPGATPVAGSWEGITFFGALASGNLLDHVQIDAAGDNGGDANFGCPPAAYPETSGALKIFNQPGSQFLTNSTISRSSTHGVFRAWTGGVVDFLAGNTFTDVAFCQQVLPKPPLPAVCPANPECPQ